jgi:hypothetical protein
MTQHAATPLRVTDSACLPFTNKELALALAAAGIPIFPCREGGKKVKAPYCTGGFKEATADRATVEAWWSKWQGALPGIVPGLLGALVIDCDVKRKADGVVAWEAFRGSGDAAPAVRTPSGGRHFWYRAPDGHIGNGRGRLPAGIDVRCDAGYVCLGTLADGGCYRAEGLTDLYAILTDPANGLEAFFLDLPAHAIAAIKDPAKRKAAPATRGLWALIDDREIETVKAALAALPDDVVEDREQWIRLGAALHNWSGGAADGWRIYDEWSARAGNYGGTTEAWASFSLDREHGVTIGTLFHMAAAQGWEGVKPRERARVKDQLPDNVEYDDFIAHLPEGNYCFLPTRSFWPDKTVNMILPAAGLGKKAMKPAVWLAKNQGVHQKTWAPGLPEIIEDMLFSNGRWIDRPNLRVLNLYQAPERQPGNSADIAPWLEHIQRVYPDDWQHIAACMAHRLQRPEEKINHALVLGGSPRTGKDTLLEPLKWGVGAANFAEEAPDVVVSAFDSYLKSVVLRFSEARDMGETNRWAFYEKMKTICASPPDTRTINEKHTKPYTIPNVTFPIITTNYKIGGLYLPVDDGRHYVAWSDMTREGFEEGYFDRLWAFYSRGGIWNVVAWLLAYDLSAFNAKAPPKKTAAFYAMADANMSNDEGDVADMLQEMKHPAVVTLECFTAKQSALAVFFSEPKNGSRIHAIMDRAGYFKVKNPDAKSGRWTIKGRKTMVYGRRDLSFRQHDAAVKKLDS